MIKFSKKKYIVLLFTIVVILILIITLFVKFWEKNKIAFCLFTTEPNKIWLDFLQSFTQNYDVFIAIDNQKDYSVLKQQYPEFQIIQISDEECSMNSYTNSDYLFKPIVATDRAFYYFNRINTQYDYIWFCEDDVYIPNIEMINTLQNQYPTADLIVPRVEINETGAEDGWPHWDQIRNIMPLPWAHSLVCLTRISKKLMKQADQFVQSYGKLLYKEVLFHTIAIQDSTMEIATPIEMSKIVWVRKNGIVQTWDPTEIQWNPEYIYHPVKDLQLHVALRQKLQN